MKSLWVLGLAWVQVCCLCSLAWSQSSPDTEQPVRYSAVAGAYINYADLESPSTSVKDKIISLHVNNERLVDALRQVAERLSLSLSYSKEQLPETQRVTVHLDGATVNKAIYSLLEGTGLRYAISANGHLVFFEKQEPLKEELRVRFEVVSGTVADAENGEAMPGVNIAVKGATIGTSSDAEGRYSLDVPSLSDTLIFSFIGYQTREVPLNGRTVVNVTLQPTTISGEEVVVVDYGYGTVNKANFTGSVASLSGEDIKRIPVANTAEAITGRLPGVNVLSTDGSPGAEIVIRVRGGGSVTQDNSPLFVVDGFIVGSIRDIPPSDIVSIDVLKDAAATALYGSQASNGVIVINTKKPQAGRMSISYNSYVQYNKLPSDRKYDVLSPYEYVMANYEHAKLRSEADLRNFEKYFGKYDDLELYKYKPGTDWQDKLFGNPRLSQYHNLSLSGGTEQTKMMLSLTHNNDDGLLIGSGFQRSTINFKLNQKLAESLQLDISTRITNLGVDGSGTSGSSQIRIKDAVTVRPVNGIADELDIDLTSINNEDEYQSFLLSMIDPTELAEQDWRKRTTNSYVLNSGLTWDILENLSIKSTFTSEKSFGENLRFYGPLTGESQKEGNSLPLGTKEESQDFSYRWLNTIQYIFRNLGKHDLDFLLGQEIYSNGGKNNYVRVEDFRKSMTPNELFANMTLGNLVGQSTERATDRNRFSLFGGANYQFNDKYLLTVAVRADASSKFKKSNRLGIFPAVAVGWKLSNEPFLEDVDFIDRLKLRVSYGKTGNDRISATAAQFLFAPSTSNGPGMGTNNYNAYYSPSGSTLYNPDLIWESTIQKNVGLDFTLFKARINGSLDLYHNSTRDLLLKSAISPVSGFSTQWNNIGSTSNKGIELGLNTYLVERKDFVLSANLNFGINRSRIDKLDGTEERFYQSNWASTDLKDRNDYYLKVGSTLGLIYGYRNDGMYSVDDFAGYNESTGEYILKEGVPDNSKTLGVNSLRPGYMKLKDLNDDGLINSEDRTVIGNALPKAQGGFGFNLNYKGFDASAFFNWSYGNDVYNTGKIEFNQFYRTRYGNMLNTMSSDNRFTYIDVDGSYTGTPGEVVTDLEQLREMNKGKEMWSGNNSFGTATTVIHDWAVEDGSFIRLNRVTIGYSLPQSLISKLSLSQCRIYATGYNLFLWTKYSGYDPEVSTTRSSTYSALTPGVDYSSYPRSRSITVGVNVTF